MATMENFRTRLARVRADSVQTGRVVLGVPLVTGLIQGISYFLLSAVLAGGVIFEGSAPFGLALVGGAGSGMNAAAALMGAAVGYLTLLGFIDGLRYVSASILTFSVAFAFYDVKLYRMPWTMPLVAAVMNGCTGFIYLSQKGWRAQDVIYFALEVWLTALFAYGFRSALAPAKGAGETERRIGSALVMAAALVSVSGLYIFCDISLGRVAAGMAVLSCAWQGGAGPGAAMGVLFGLAMDLSAQAPVLYTMVLGVSGLSAGLLRGRKRSVAAAAYALGGMAAVLWTWDGGVRQSAIYETIAGAAIFLAVPARLLREINAQFIPERKKSADDGVRDHVRIRLQAAAQAFHSIHETMRSSFRRPPANENDAAAIFDRAADRVCRSCALRSTCWEREYVTTFNALNDATRTIVDRGRGEAGDFPAYFSSRCIKFPEFLGAVNEELSALLYRRQFNGRLQDSRRAVCSQYGQLSALLEEAAAELGQELTADPERERRLRQHLAVLGLEGESTVFYDRDHRLHARICGSAARKLTGSEETAVLSGLMGMSMYAQRRHADVLELIQSEPFMAVAGVAARRKSGETVSGDAGTWFKRSDGQLYVLLCDGMGSGAAANRESGLAVRLLEQFLKAGVETENALMILNSALSLREEDEGGFTTVDLLQIDLFTGQAAIFKLGAAPTYIKTAKGVRRIVASSLPAGVCGQDVRPDCTRLRLEEGDCILMISDGVCGVEEDSWLRSKLVGFDGVSPKELARDVIDDGAEGADDRTALAVRFVRRA